MTKALKGENVFNKSIMNALHTAAEKLTKHPLAKNNDPVPVFVITEDIIQKHPSSPLAEYYRAIQYSPNTLGSNNDLGLPAGIYFTDLAIKGLSDQQIIALGVHEIVHWRFDHPNHPGINPPEGVTTYASAEVFQMNTVRKQLEHTADLEANRILPQYRQLFFSAITQKITESMLESGLTNQDAKDYLGDSTDDPFSSHPSISARKKYLQDNETGSRTTTTSSNTENIIVPPIPDKSPRSR